MKNSSIFFSLTLFIISVFGLCILSSGNVYAQSGFYDGSLPGIVIRVEILDSNSDMPIENAEVKFRDKNGNVCGRMVTGADGIVVFGVSVSIKDPTEIEVRAKDHYSIKGSFPLARLKKHTANSWEEPLSAGEISSFKFEYNPSDAILIRADTSSDSVEEYFEKVKNGEYEQYHSGNLLIPIKIKMSKIPRGIR